MDYKLIVSDFDDTLHVENIGIPESTKAVIREYCEAGGKFAIATGRSLHSILPYLEDLPCIEYVITHNGSNVYDIKKGEYVTLQRMGNDVVINILQDLENDGLECQIYNGDDVWAMIRTPYIKDYERLTGCNILETKMPLSQYLFESKLQLDKILAYVDPKYTLSYIDKYNEKYGSLVQFMTSKPYFLEAVSAEAGKGEMCLALARLLGISSSEMICLGDSINDITMIKCAGLGVAMGNGRLETKAVADYITDTNVNEGVKQVIEKYGLGR